ncbi:hypothetical protein DMB90_27945 [Raoultella planticola]|uniref:Uncharacterized protein n=1 Tax=Raoultella planticola TaxID=575 RepID=A0A5P6ABS3_RAOPL|nr:hypothetical protein DMB90_27945 [Raoultella planticola]
MTAEAENAAAQRSKGQRSCKHRVPLKIKIMFLFYETAFYFLRTHVLVIEIVIICFKKHGTAGRDKAQQKAFITPVSLNFAGICGEKSQ